MVKELAGYGSRYRDLALQHGIDLRAHRHLKFPHNLECELRLDAFLKGLKQYPEFDKQAFLLRDVVNRDDPIDVVLVPRSCPSIYLEDKSKGDMPREGETWVVQAWLGEEGRRFEFLGIFDDARFARRFVSERAAYIFHCRPGEVQTAAKLVSPEEWMDEARRKLEAGVKLPETILKFGDLREVARRCVNSGKTS